LSASYISETSPGSVTAEIFLFLVDSAVHFKWLLNQSTATAMLGRRQILLGFPHHTSSTAGGLALPLLVCWKVQRHFYRLSETLSTALFLGC
jgi:hypothetical protein